MILYHGGSEAIERPDLVHSRKAVDFGPGFYATPLRAQAASRCRKRGLRGLPQIVSVYDFDEARTASLNILRFDSYSAEWLDFIVACRGLADRSQWDIVVGGIANDRVFDTLEAFFDGYATREQTIGRLRMQSPNLQMCFRTQAAIETLRFIGSEAP